MNTGEATVEQATRNVRPHVIKWEGTLKESIKKNIAANYDERRLRQVHYRPFTKMWIYYDPLFINSVYRIPVMFPDRSDGANQAIVVAGRGSTREFSTVATNTAPDLELVSKGQAMPRYEHASPNLALSLSLWANQTIYITGPGASVGFSTLVTDSPPDLHLLSGGQAFPRYTHPTGRIR